MRHLSGLTRGAVNVIMAGFFVLVGAGAAAQAGRGKVADLLVVVALLCGAAGGSMLMLARRRGQAHRVDR
ncbi:MAG: hypothetical protein ABSB76_31225 [Streptosporangiaceae bacterium]|jgi:hypothetical protein